MLPLIKCVLFELFSKKKKKKKKQLYSRATKSQYKVTTPCVLRVSGDHWTENLVLVSSDK